MVQEHATRLSFQFEAPLKEFVRTVKSARAVMVDRSQALTALQQARIDVDAKRTKLAKLRGTPGIKVGLPRRQIEPSFPSPCGLLFDVL